MAKENKHDHDIHKTLAKSYSVHFVFFLIGITIHLLFPVMISDTSLMNVVGGVFLVVGSFLAFWAQNSTRVLDVDNPEEKLFEKGPYIYTRTPTHYGLSFLIIGFGFVINALWVIMFTVMALVISKIFYLNKWEELLEERYGDVYRKYKENVKF